MNSWCSVFQIDTKYVSTSSFKSLNMFLLPHSNLLHTSQLNPAKASEITNNMCLFYHHCHPPTARSNEGIIMNYQPPNTALGYSWIFLVKSCKISQNYHTTLGSSLIHPPHPKKKWVPCMVTSPIQKKITAEVGDTTSGSFLIPCFWHRVSDLPRGMSVPLEVLGSKVIGSVGSYNPSIFHA